MPQAIQCPDRIRHGSVEHPLTEMGARGLSLHDEPQIGFVNEVASGSRGDTRTPCLSTLHDRLRKAFESESGLFAGPVEVDETYMGDKRKNMPNSMREELTDLGAVGKTAVVGAIDRTTNQVRARAVESTNKATIHGFVADHTALDATVYTDDAFVYETLPKPRQGRQPQLSGVCSWLRAYQRAWRATVSMLKRAYQGTFRQDERYASRPVLEGVM